MGDAHQYDPYYTQGGGGTAPGGGATPSRGAGMMRRSAGGGEIVEVQGGHIVRSTGRKDRHSKVCTAKGPRDRRVRLSAHTAIEFYDVQDRLGYDRPSKAVDWLIKKAKSAIDDLAELPAWKPTATPSSAVKKTPRNNNPPPPPPPPPPQLNHQRDSFTFQPVSGFLPPSLDSDAIADTIKSFFPMGSTDPVPDLLSRTSSQDLRLSLHSQEQQPPQQHMFPAGHFIGFEGASGGGGGGWPDHHQQFGFIPQSMVFGQNQFVMSQRGPLQSSINSHSVRAWASADQMGFSAGGSSGFRVPARIQGDDHEEDGIHKPSSTSSESRH